jgi:tight adherence protein B
LLPVAVALGINLLNPEYGRQLFEPGIMRLVLIVGIVLQVLGFLIMRKIVDIEV